MIYPTYQNISSQFDSIVCNTVKELGQKLKVSTGSFQLANPSFKSTKFEEVQGNQDE